VIAIGIVCHGRIVSLCLLPAIPLHQPLQAGFQLLDLDLVLLGVQVKRRGHGLTDPHRGPRVLSPGASPDGLPDHGYGVRREEVCGVLAGVLPPDRDPYLVPE
jgi:hypothetical protein